MENNFCSFCQKSGHETYLIDTTSNSLLINNKCYEFSYIFNDLLQFTSSDECICEACKDLMISFYMFKRNIKFPHNDIFRLLIKNQIEEFLNQNSQNIEDIKVIRTVNSITLQIDREDLQQNIVAQNKPTEEVFEDVQQGFEEALISYQCSRCDKIENSENESEIHEFLKHSSFGAQLQVEIENSKAYRRESDDAVELIYVCSFCAAEIDSFDAFLLHLLNIHNPEVVFQINESLNIPAHLLDFKIIKEYLSHVKDCIMNEHFNANFDFEQKKYFYEIYSELDEPEHEVCDDDHVEQHEDDNIEIDNTPEPQNVEYQKEKTPKKTEKLSEDLTSDDKDWVKKEITKGKSLVVNPETGQSSVIFKCLVTKACKYLSKSAPGLRYHIIMKHLRHRNEQQLEAKEEDHPIETSTDTYKFIMTKNSSKNCCIDCSLKFKDSRAYQLHEKCHDLFLIIAKYSIFPACSTCNKKFINHNCLQQHLAKHENGENLEIPIKTSELGALRKQGKFVNGQIQSVGETTETNFSWKCGHCVDKNFLKEEHCNFHILLFHTITFACPVDRMQFSGFKSVSLYLHHLMNKHSTLFPNLSFKCTFCAEEFSTIYDKLSHMKGCDRKNLQCDHCDKRFWKKGDLIAHLRFVTGEVQFPCTYCNKKCISASDLKIHLRSHTKIKPYQCSLCTKSFRTLAARSAHLDAHNSNLLFTCEICDKSFRQRQLYRRHVKTIHENKGNDISR